MIVYLIFFPPFVTLCSCPTDLYSHGIKNDRGMHLCDSSIYNHVSHVRVAFYGKAQVPSI